MPDRGRMAALLVRNLRDAAAKHARDFEYERMLLSWGGAGLAPLIAELRASEPAVRSWAAEMLRQMGSAEAVAALRPFVSAPEPETRLAVGKALVAVKDLAALDALIPVAAESMPWIRLEALQALGELGDPQVLPLLMRAFRDSSVNIRNGAAAALQKIGAPAVPALLDMGLVADSETRVSILHCLKHIGDRRALGFALLQLDDPSQYVRAAAVACIGRLQMRDARDMLESRLGDSVPWVRREICEALGQLGDRASLPLLLQRLKEDPDISVRAGAAKALRSYGTEDVCVPLLHALMAEEDSYVLEEILSGLAEVGDARIVELLALFDPWRLPGLSRKERVRLERKASFAAGRIRFRLASASPPAVPGRS